MPTPLEFAGRKFVTVECWDKNTVSKDVLIGSATLNVRDVVTGPPSVEVVVRDVSRHFVPLFSHLITSSPLLSSQILTFIFFFLFLFFVISLMCLTFTEKRAQNTTQAWLGSCMIRSQET